MSRKSRAWGAGSVGDRAFGVSAIALGVLDVARRAFPSPWQAIPPLAHADLIALAVGGVIILCGAAVLLGGRLARAGAPVLAAILTVFILLKARDVISAPLAVGAWLGVAESSAVVLGALAAFAMAQASPSQRLLGFCRTAFALCLVAFGLAHFVYVKETAAMVPTWLPLGGKAWAWITGACDIAAGLALLVGVRAMLAAHLAAVMFAGFGLLVWAPQLFGKAVPAVAWGGTVITFMIAAATWAMADAIGRETIRRR